MNDTGFNFDSYDDLERYERYADAFDPVHHDRQARRTRKPKPNHQPKKASEDQIQEVAETVGLEAGFSTTYTPSKFEAGWLMSALRPFYDQGYIADVEALLKGGKEAHVYRCKATPATGQEWLAVKVYRPRMFRNLRNDQRYRQGRPTLELSGRPVDGSDKRVERAVGKKSAFGHQVAHTSWLMYEYTTLELLHRHEAAVPRPYAAAGNAILMSYIGDGHGPAPTLNEVNVAPEEARPLFEKVVDNIALMLSLGRVHGDLSAYNILFWQGAVTLIDFPQVVNSQVKKDTHFYGSDVNPEAYDILVRDVERVCDYFAGQGLASDERVSHPERLTERLWQQYTEPMQVPRWMLEDEGWQA